METPAVSLEPAGVERDRLSELPDRLLTDVLSRSGLTSRQAARTSLLSRRWRHLWRAVPFVDLDHREFWSSKDEEATPDIDLEGVDIRAHRLLISHEKIRRQLEQEEKFEDFADDVLLPSPHRGTPPLDTLRLRVSCLDFKTVARRWIRRGLQRRPVAFHLCCDNDVTLAYGEDRQWPYFPGITLPRQLGAFACRLRTLHLAGVSLCDDFADCVAAGFLALEDLQLEHCKYDFGRLASHSLRKLFIDCCFRQYSCNDVLAIAAPRIASLHIDAHSPPVTVVGEMPSLTTASVASKAGELGFLRSLRYARSLNLSGFSTAALLGDWDPRDFPEFRNLRTLLLDECDVGIECQVLRRFLRNAPSLETLTLRDCAFSGGSRRSKKRKARSGEKTSSSSDRCSPAAYECENLKWIFCEGGHAVDELAQALSDISKEVVHPVETSVQDGKRTVRILFA